MNLTPVTDLARRRVAWLQLRPFRKHGRVLIGGGLIYVAYGIALAKIGLTDQRRIGLSVVLRLTNGSLLPWALMWVGVGAIAVVSTRWPVWWKSWGYAAMGGLAALWSLNYLTGMVFVDIGIDNAAGFLVWSLLSFMWWAIADLPDADFVHALTENHDNDGG